MSPRPFTVLVTGCGPFPNGNGGRYNNASHALTKLLPTTLTSPHGTPIRILNPTAADDAYLRVEYAWARSYLASLHETTTFEGHEVDLYLHLGQAAGWDFVSVERGAYGQGKQGWYDRSPDDSGERAPPPSPWQGLPGFLDTGFAVDDIVSRVGKRGGGLEVRAHDEPGGYLCGFICYESLANRLSRGRDGRCLFCHVPGETGEEDLLRAREAILAIVGAVAEQVREKEGKETGNEGEEDGWVKV